jgi:hypothetical protein
MRSLTGYTIELMKIAAGWLGMALTVTGASLAPAVAHAQAVQGQLVNVNDGTPIKYAFVILRDTTDREVLRVLTDQQGSFFIEAPGTGVYLLQTAIIGWRSWTSPQFTLVEGETFAYRMAVPLEAIRLDALIVEGTHECRTDPDSGRAVSVLWEEARKALKAVTWTQGTGQLRYQVIEFNRDLHPETLRSMGGQASRQSGMATGSPFTSMPAEQLSTMGYIQDMGEGVRPYGPDAEVLLSESFANDHCFIVQPHPDEPGLIGLGFQPISSREIPDIRGVMWLDRETAQLRTLEFRYDRLPWPVSLRHAGGEISFEQLPTGMWFVSDWRLRLPRLTRSTRGTTLGQYRVRSYAEGGGYVVELRRPDGSPMARFAAATSFDLSIDSTTRSVSVDGELPSGIAGAVTEVLNGTIVEGALVLLLDAAQTIRGVTLSDSNGTFAVRAPRAGSYSMTIHRVGYRPTASSLVDIPTGIVIRTRVNLRESEPRDMERDRPSRRQFGDVIPQFRFLREEIDRTGAQSVFELALTINGVRSVGALDRPVLLLNDNQCAPTVYIDGNPSATSQVLHTPFTTWVKAVEVSLSPSDTPPENLAEDPDVAKCGTILIWSTAS